MEQKDSKDWFKHWFDSEYYHLLYKDRDFNEAEHFISNLLKYLKPSPNSKFLDLACGKGRHSVFINKSGHNVLGVDLSENCINYAKQFSNESLTFKVHDMREMFYPETFDFVLNLFTSFGYFDDELENLNTLISVKNSLRRGGTLVIDFFNADKVIKNLIPQETKIVERISFNILKKIDNGKIIKTIQFEADGKHHEYHERVQLLTLDTFTELFRQARFQIIDVFGNYNLEDFDEASSDRLILVAQKL